MFAFVYILTLFSSIFELWLFCFGNFVFITLYTCSPSGVLKVHAILFIFATNQIAIGIAFCCQHRPTKFIGKLV